MSLTDIQLYANNARGTMPISIGSVATELQVQVGQGERFPVIDASNEFFLITLESSGIIEVCKVTARVEDTFTIVRAQEGTPASAFPSGTLVQMRVTKGTLEQMARLTDRLGDLASVDNLPQASVAIGNSFLCQSTDEAGNPIIAVRRAGYWRFTTHNEVFARTIVQESTTTSVTTNEIAPLQVVTGRFIVTFLTGVLAGVSRLVTSSDNTRIIWDTPTSVVPPVGTEFEIMASNSFSLLTASQASEIILNHIIAPDPHPQYVLEANRTISIVGDAQGSVLTDLSGNVEVPVKNMGTTRFTVRTSDFIARTNVRYYCRGSFGVTLPDPLVDTLVAGDSVTLYKSPTSTVLVTAAGTPSISTTEGVDKSVSYDFEDEIMFVYDGTNWLI